jgi:hypothetical protein
LQKKRSQAEQQTSKTTVGNQAKYRAMAISIRQQVRKPPNYQDHRKPPFSLPMLRARKRLRMKVKEARGREVLVSAKPLFPSCLFYIFNTAAVLAQHSFKTRKSRQLLGCASFERQGPVGLAS